MRYNQLRAFHNVALHGGFSRAAEALHQSQPALSEQVRQLEQKYDTLLFYRRNRQVRLTEAGDGLFVLTKQFFESENNISEYLHQSHAAISGTLRIVADSALHIIHAVSRFRHAYPHVHVIVQTGNTELVLQRLRHYDAEIGVVGNLKPVADLDIRELGSTPVIAIAAKSIIPKGMRSIAFTDLPQWPLVFRESGSRTRQSIEAKAQEQKMVLAPVIEVDGREAMREVIASGAGIGFISSAECGDDSRLRQLPIDGMDVAMSETLVYMAMRRDVPLIRAFVECV